MIYPVTSTSDTSTVTVASAQLTPTMARGEVYLFTASVACWIAQGTNPTASASDGNMYVPAGVTVMIDGGVGAKLAVIRASGDGTASLTRCKVL